MQRIGNILGVLRGNRFLALAVVLLVIVSFWRFAPLGDQLSIGGIIQTIKGTVPEAGGQAPTAPPTEGGEKPLVTGPSKPSGVSTAVGRGKDIAGRVARATGSILSTPAKQWTQLLRNMNIGQSAVLAVIAAFLFRRGILTWIVDLVFGQLFDAGQAIDRRARAQPVLQWLVYIVIGAAILYVITDSLKKGFTSLLEVSLTTILPLLIFAWAYTIAPRLRTELGSLAQAASGALNPAFNLAWLALLLYVAISWALRVILGPQVVTVAATLASQPKLVNTVLGWAAGGVRLVDAVIVNEYVGWGGLLLLALAAARELAPTRRGAP